MNGVLKPDLMPASVKDTPELVRTFLPAEEIGGSERRFKDLLDQGPLERSERPVRSDQRPASNGNGDDMLSIFSDGIRRMDTCPEDTRPDQAKPPVPARSRQDPASGRSSVPMPETEAFLADARLAGTDKPLPAATPQPSVSEQLSGMMAEMTEFTGRTQQARTDAPAPSDGTQGSAVAHRSDTVPQAAAFADGMQQARTDAPFPSAAPQALSNAQRSGTSPQAAAFADGTPQARTDAPAPSVETQGSAGSQPSGTAPQAAAFTDGTQQARTDAPAPSAAPQDAAARPGTDVPGQGSPFTFRNEESFLSPGRNGSPVPGEDAGTPIRGRHTAEKSLDEAQPRPDILPKVDPFPAGDIRPDNAVDKLSPSIPVQRDELSKNLDELVERILVSAPDSGRQEVRITLNDTALKGTDIIITRDLYGTLEVTLSSSDASSFQTLVSAQDELMDRLNRTERGSVRVNIENSAHDDANDPRRRSKGYEQYTAEE